MSETAFWGDAQWGASPWGGGLAWGAREGGDPSDLSAPLLTIPVGSLATEQTAADRIWKQFEVAQTWADLMAVLGVVFGQVEATLAQVDHGRYLSTAAGVQLDEIGAMVGRSRGSLTDDDDYRIAILVDAATLFSSGTLPEILELATALAGDQAEVTEFYPAAFRLRIPGLDAARFDLLLDVLADTPPAGVGALLSTFDETRVGGWGSVHGSVSSPATWSSVYGPVDDPLAHWATARGI